ncbi:MAG: methyl-accepting chemotaxis protein [Deltaproteobacteria bacterium]|jgi:methyl-accepting chemotaxis protein|nr:methyl-accepting chemotaxis protein [Deltaproteobacteria bacterium]
MGLKSKIAIGFAAICLIFIAVSVIVAVELAAISYETHELNNVITPSAAKAAELKYSVTREALLIAGYAESGQDGLWAAATEVRRLNNAMAEELKGPVGLLSADRPELAQGLAAFESSYRRFQESSERLPELNRSDRDTWDKTLKEYDGFQEALRGYEQAMDERLAASLRSGAEFSELKIQYRRVASAADLRRQGGDFFATLQAGHLTRDVSALERSASMLERLRTASEAIRDDTRFPANKALLETVLSSLAGCKEAISRLKVSITASAFSMTEGAEARNQAIEAITGLSGDFGRMTREFAEMTGSSIGASRRLLLVGVAAALALSAVMSILLIRGIVGPLVRISEALADGSVDVDMTAGEISSASGKVADGNARAATALEETSASVEELSSMTRRNTENALRAREVITGATEYAAKSAESSDQTMDKVMEAMNQIAASGSEIGKIIKTIDEIAFQTNILALNASVEAARAGEAGAGFAVVADEVRNLAIKSKEAAKNTGELIANTIDNISLGTRLVRQSSETFNAVVESVKKVYSLIGEVAEASKQQAAGISQINAAIRQLDQVTQGSAAVSEETASHAAVLSRNADHLEEQVEQLLRLIEGSAARHLATARETAGAAGQGAGRGGGPAGRLLPPAS